MQKTEYCLNCKDMVIMNIADGGVRCSKCGNFFYHGGVRIGDMYKDEFEKIKEKLNNLI